MFLSSDKQYISNLNVKSLPFIVFSPSKVQQFKYFTDNIMALSVMVGLVVADDDFSFSLQGAPQLCAFFSRLNISVKTKRSEFFIKTGAAEFFIKFFAEPKSH